MISSPIPPAGHIPPAFLQVLVELETAISATIASEKTATKKVAVVKAKALQGMRQTLKKKMKEFEAVLATYNEVRSQSRSEANLRRIQKRMPRPTSDPMQCPPW